MQDNPLIPTICQSAIEEIVAALGFARQGPARRLLSPLFWLPAHLLARLLAEVDEPARQSGLPGVARRLLPRFVSGVQTAGAADIPEAGPLIIATNHPGAYDALAILSNVPRQDIKFIVSDVPILRSVPSVAQSLIYTPPQTELRARAVREIMRTLRQGGAILIFPSGVVDPDPAFMPGAEQALHLWSASLGLILSKVPGALLQTAIVSGVLAPACLRSPLTRLPKERWRQQKLAEFLQVIQQLVFKRNFHLTPRVYFGKPRPLEGLLSDFKADSLHQSILAAARETLRLNLGMAGAEIR
ncbi:MAG: hypothetical protein B6D39_11300 [Anaerolineae bacterium UTCFX2]|jgi:1-acyl-sn-glycerol-3-phosphate acyltransferase|nr:hypothetical protein [Anaerolineales bacterium]OQY88370.1 MAG: hypothetical protein B6D39_11300 [Anaerolineae bacterium UTCFX2]